jgi:hypothetical protein
VSVRKDYLDYLVEQGVLSTDKLQMVLERLHTPPEPIGSIAFSHGLLSCQDIDCILDEQRHSRLQFGQIAVQRGLLTSEHIDTLLQIQATRAASEVAEALALSGLCPPPVALEYLGRFLILKAGACLTV